ncbi:MAG: VanZ family protein [Hylemonella sp.]|jgi:VanZ family protein
MALRKTSAWPLALVYVGLIVYASLYPFVDWRDQGVPAWDFLLSPWPKYWTGFDLLTNVIGYAPLGFLLALSALRSRRQPSAIWLASLSASVLSLLMEALQAYLPARVPSNVDWGLNTLGAWAGAVVAAALEGMGWLDRWSRFRDRWFVPDAHGALVLLALWPLALLFPAAVPLGLGQVLERLELALSGMLVNTPFLEWLPVRDIELQPLVPGAELGCVMLGLLIPVLLGFSVIPDRLRRLVFLLTALGAGVSATALSAALSYGPVHAWAWLNLPAQAGLGLALGLALVLLNLSARSNAALMLLALGIYLSVINQAPTNAYFAQTLQAWEQGRFIRFHGLGQWLGWLWPYAALAYVLARIGHQDQKTRIKP